VGIAAGRATAASGGNRLFYMQRRPRGRAARGCARLYHAEGVRPRGGRRKTARGCDRGRDGGSRAATGMRTGRRGWDKTLFLQISPQSPRANPSRGAHGTTSSALSVRDHGDEKFDPVKSRVSRLRHLLSIHSCNSRTAACVHYTVRLVIFVHSLLSRTHLYSIYVYGGISESRSSPNIVVDKSIKYSSTISKGVFATRMTTKTVSPPACA